MISRIELESGVNAEPGRERHRRRRLDGLLETIKAEMFVHADILAYGQIVYDLGYDHRLTLHRLMAAPAMVRNALLITRNGKDFRSIKGLRPEVWETPI